MKLFSIYVRRPYTAFCVWVYHARHVSQRTRLTETPDFQVMCNGKHGESTPFFSYRRATQALAIAPVHAAQSRRRVAPRVAHAACTAVAACAARH